MASSSSVEILKSKNISKEKASEILQTFLNDRPDIVVQEEGSDDGEMKMPSIEENTRHQLRKILHHLQGHDEEMEEDTPYSVFS